MNIHFRLVDTLLARAVSGEGHQGRLVFSSLGVPALAVKDCMLLVEFGI